MPMTDPYQYPNVLANTFAWFTTAVPNPEPTNFHAQIGTHVEEVHEMLVELTPQDEKTANLLQDANIALVALADHLKASDNAVVVLPENRKDFLDAIVDQLVTGTGVANFQKMDVVGALNAVNIQNYSKFVNGKPIFDQNMKIAKGPDYKKADLSPFV